MPQKWAKYCRTTVYFLVVLTFKLGIQVSCRMFADCLQDCFRMSTLVLSLFINFKNLIIGGLLNRQHKQMSLSVLSLAFAIKHKGPSHDPCGITYYISLVSSDIYIIIPSSCRYIYPPTHSLTTKVINYSKQLCASLIKHCVVCFISVVINYLLHGSASMLLYGILNTCGCN